MAAAITNQNSSYEVRVTVEDRSPQVEKESSVSWGKYILGFGLGLGTFLIYGPITERIIKALGVNFENPFNEMHIIEKVIMMPIICILGPIAEEQVFRGSLYDLLKEKFQSFYSSMGFSEGASRVASRITTVFFSSIIFGLIHFTNAIAFECSPLLFLPQVVATTVMGILFALAKEISGGLEVPIGMHIGNNTLSWSVMMLSEFYV